MRSSEYINDLGDVRPIPDDAREVFTGITHSVWQWQQPLYDGSLTTYEALKRTDTAHIVGVTPDGHILLTEDTQPNRSAVLTPPGGQVEPGETPAAAAARELREETGYRAAEIIPWHHFRAHTKVEWIVHAFIGKNVTPVTDPTPEAGEKITIRLFSFDEFLNLGYGTKLRDRIMRTILLTALLDPTKRAELHSLLYD